MTIYFFGIYYKLDNCNAFRIYAQYNLQNIGYLKRSYAKDFIHLLAREFTKSHDTNEPFCTMEHIHSTYNYKINMMTEDNKYYYIIITDIDYDTKLSRLVLCQIASEFNKIKIREKIPKYVVSDMNLENKIFATIIDKYNTYRPNEKIDKIKENLNDLTEIMKNNIDKIVVRDIKINELLVKSQNVSTQADEFRKSATKLNKCCGWW
jgi:synaptobrevin family protein YKT6